MTLLIDSLFFLGEYAGHKEKIVMVAQPLSLENPQKLDSLNTPSDPLSLLNLGKAILKLSIQIVNLD